MRGVHGSRPYQPEYLGYLGWPLLIVLAAVAVLLWRRLAVRAVAVAFLVLEVFSLGGTLLAAGVSTVAQAALVLGADAAGHRGSDPGPVLDPRGRRGGRVFALGLDAARARWPALRCSPARWRPHACWAVAAAALIAIAPIVPRPLPAGSGPGVPAGWTAAFTALRLSAGARVLVVPLPASTFTEPLRWQADTGVPSSMFGGYFMGPRRDGQAETDGAGLPVAGLYLNRLWERVAGRCRRRGRPGRRPAARIRQAPTDAQLRAQLTDVAPGRRRRGHHGKLRARPVPAPGSCGPPAVSVGGVLGWRLPVALLSSWPGCLARTENLGGVGRREMISASSLRWAISQISRNNIDA